MIGSVFKTLTEDGEQHYRGAARRRGQGQRHHRGRAAGHQLLRPDHATVGGGQRGGKIAEQVFVSPLPDKPLEICCARTRHAVLVVAARAGDQAPKDDGHHRTSPADRAVGADHRHRSDRRRRNRSSSTAASSSGCSHRIRATARASTTSTRRACATGYPTRRRAGPSA